MDVVVRCNNRIIVVFFIEECRDDLAGIWKYGEIHILEHVIVFLLKVLFGFFFYLVINPFLSFCWSVFILSDNKMKSDGI